MKLRAVGGGTRDASVSGGTPFNGSLGFSMAEASLSRSDVSFRRQGSSGIVWGIPNKFERTSSHNNIMEARAGAAASSSSPSASSMFCYSRSTDSIETRFHCGKPADAARARTGKSGFRFARWIRRIFSKSG